MQFGPSSGTSLAPMRETAYDPSRAFRFFDHFLTYDTTATTGDWRETEATGTGAKSDAHGGVVTLSGTTTDDQGAQIQSSSEVFLPGAAGRKTYFEARVKISEVGKCQFFAGLAKIDTTIFASGELTAAATTPRIGFYMSATSQAASAGRLQFTVGDATGSSDAVSQSAFLLTSATWHIIGFEYDYDRGRARVFLDGVLIEDVSVAAANVPTEELCVSFAAYSELTPGATLTVDIDYVDVIATI